MSYQQHYKRIPFCANLLRLKHLLFGIIIFTALCSYSNNLLAYDVTGQAYNEKQELLYTEHYSFSKTETLVIYKSPNGEVLAAKSLNYNNDSHGKNSYTPEITIYHHKEKTTYLLSNNKEHLHLKAFDAKKNKRTVRKTETSNNLVIDAAFDIYIKDHWQALKSQAQKIAFALAQHGKIYDVSISPSRDMNCQQRSDHCFSITPNNWFFKLIAGSTIIGYNQQKQLRYFYGPSNSIAQKSKERVQVFYTHKKTPELVAAQ